jgi:hypothetical protein
MRYQTPELTPLTLAINAIQALGSSKMNGTFTDAIPLDEEKEAVQNGYSDWE